MKDNKIKKVLAGTVVKSLNQVLKSDANSCSCMYFYQPKAPESISRFKKNK